MSNHLIRWSAFNRRSIYRQTSAWALLSLSSRLSSATSLYTIPTATCNYHNEPAKPAVVAQRLKCLSYIEALTSQYWLWHEQRRPWLRIAQDESFEICEVYLLLKNMLWKDLPSKTSQSHCRWKLSLIQTNTTATQRRLVHYNENVIVQLYRCERPRTLICLLEPKPLFSLPKLTYTYRRSCSELMSIYLISGLETRNPKSLLASTHHTHTEHSISRLGDP